MIISTADYRGAGLVRLAFDPVHWELIQGSSMLNQEVGGLLDGVKGPWLFSHVHLPTPDPTVQTDNTLEQLVGLFRETALEESFSVSGSGERYRPIGFHRTSVSDVFLIASTHKSGYFFINISELFCDLMEENQFI